MHLYGLGQAFIKTFVCKLFESSELFEVVIWSYLQVIDPSDWTSQFKKSIKLRDAVIYVLAEFVC